MFDLLSGPELKKMTSGLAESNGSLLPGDDFISYLWADCTPGSAPDPTLGNEYGKTLPKMNM